MTRLNSSAPAFPGSVPSLQTAPGEYEPGRSLSRLFRTLTTCPGTAHEDGASWHGAGWLAPLALPISFDAIQKTPLILDGQPRGQLCESFAPGVAAQAGLQRGAVQRGREASNL